MAEKYEIRVPNIGDFSDVEIIEVLIRPGDCVVPEQPLITLESDKATLEVPAPDSGKISTVKVAVGDRISEGDIIAIITPDTELASKPAPKAETKVPDKENGQTKKNVQKPPPEHSPPPSLPPPVERSGTTLPHASPSIRRLARELGADLSQINGSGTKGRILDQDVKQWVKNTLQRKTNGSNAIPEIPVVDFSRFGEVEVEQLSRIKAISGPHLHRAWLNVPMVTHHDEANITDLEAFRQSLKNEVKAKGIRITLLAFAIKALVNALKQFPQFNASLAPDKKSLILKKYYNIGIAIDTPQGLVVPSIKSAETKSIFELAAQMQEISQRARDGKLKPDELQGASISISSLGGIGGMAFTPLINSPEVAILGLTRASIRPVWDGKQFQPRLMLPLDLSYDHRAIDGAQAARFMSYLCQLFGDTHRLSL